MTNRITNIAHSSLISPSNIPQSSHLPHPLHCIAFQFIPRMSSATVHTTPVPSVSSADKSKPIFPLMIANDGFSEVGEEKEASATCCRSPLLSTELYTP